MNLELELFYFQSSPFFLAVFCPFIGRVAHYTPSSRPKNASKIKANLEFHKSSDDFIENGIQSEVFLPGYLHGVTS